MDLNFTKKERKLLKLAEEIIDKWRDILHLDPLWSIDLTIFDDDTTPGAFARVDASTTEYFFATIEISYSMLQLREEDFEAKMNEAACHELLHLVMVDFFRSSQLVAGENEAMQNELKYKYEQFTSRLQKAFIQLYESRSELAELQKKLDIVRELWVSDRPDRLSIIEKILDLEESLQKLT
ncbi:MAG: hypothetical protein WC516_04370 [Patescibacteria group bacterium]|jgi:hypothetical protein